MGKCLLSSPEGLLDIEGRKERKKEKNKPDTFKGHFNLPSFNPAAIQTRPGADALGPKGGRGQTDRRRERERDSTLQGRAAALLAPHESCI